MEAGAEGEADDSCGAVGKTSVFLAFLIVGNYDGANNKKTHQEKQYKIAVRVLSILISVPMLAQFKHMIAGISMFPAYTPYLVC
jgi:hypothetical protein